MASGGMFETRDPNWSIEAGAQAITEAISSDPKPDVLVVHSPDLNSYSKLLKKAQEAGIYVVLIDNPTNFPADAFIGSDWDRLGQLEAEAVDQGLRRRLLEEDRPRAGRPGQRLQPLSICRNHEGAGEASGFQGGRQARLELGRDDRRAMSTTTMLQQNPDICGIIDFWDGDATGAAAAIRDAGWRARSSWSPPAAAKRSTATISSPAPSAQW